MTNLKQIHSGKATQELAVDQGCFICGKNVDDRNNRYMVQDGEGLHWAGHKSCIEARYRRKANAD